MCVFSKSEYETSEALIQTPKVAFNSNKTNIEEMRSIAKAYATKRECSVQEAVYLGFEKASQVLFLQLAICQKIAIEFVAVWKKLMNNMKTV